MFNLKMEYASIRVKFEDNLYIGKTAYFERFKF